MFLVVTVLQSRDHCLDRDHGVVDQQAEGNDESAQRDSLKVDPKEFHRHEYDGEHERDGEGHHCARAHTEAEQANPKNDGDGLPQGFHELVDRVLDRHGLVGHKRRLDSDGQVRCDLRHGVLDVAP